MLQYLSLIILGIAASVLGECPNMEDVPTYDETQEVFVCSRVWKEEGHELSVNACNGDFLTYTDGENHDASDGNYLPMGSMFVKPGCDLYMFWDYNFEGSSNIVSGPAEVYENTWGNWGYPGARSLKCRCRQKKIDCEPSDGYEMVLYCDNTDGLAEATCSYEKTIGTSYSSSISENMSIDRTIQAELTAQFFGLFSSSIGASVSTGYDWTQTSTETRHEQVTVTVSAPAPPGLVLVIEQAVGDCDESQARTEMYRISHHDNKGNVLRQTTGHFPGNSPVIF